MDPDEITYELLRDDYRDEAIAKKRRSVRNGKMHFTRLDKFFGGWKLKDFTTKSLKLFRQECLKTGLTNAGANRQMAALRRMFNLGVQNHEDLKRSDIPSYFPMEKEPNKNPNAIFIERAWYDSLLRMLTEPLRSAFVVCYHTGMRVEEMRRLRWRHTDLKKKEILLPGEITKTGDPRTVFIPRDFALKAGQPDDLIFPLDDKHTRTEWQNACVRLGFGGYRCRSCGATWKGTERPASCTHIKHRLTYVGPLLRHTRHTAARNMDAVMSRDRAKAIIGHQTDSMYTRYNIGKERDVEEARRLVEQAHRLKKG